MTFTYQGVVDASTNLTDMATQAELDSHAAADATQAELDAVVAQKGAANGIATLDSTSKLTASQLPSTVVSRSPATSSANDIAPTGGVNADGLRVRGRTTVFGGIADQTVADVLFAQANANPYRARLQAVTQLEGAVTTCEVPLFVALAVRQTAFPLTAGAPQYAQVAIQGAVDAIGTPGAPCWGVASTVRSDQDFSTPGAPGGLWGAEFDVVTTGFDGSQTAAQNTTGCLVSSGSTKRPQNGYMLGGNQPLGQWVWGFRNAGNPVPGTTSYFPAVWDAGVTFLDEVRSPTHAVLEVRPMARTTPTTVAAPAPGAGDTTITVASAAAITAPGVVLIDTEQIAYTAKTATTLTGCTRGANGTTAAAHSVGASVVLLGAGPPAVASPSFRLQGNGRMAWGRDDGTGGIDVALGRSSAGVLTLEGKLIASVGVTVLDTAAFNVGTLGFFGTAPIARPTGVAVTAGAIHAALVSLGLIVA